MKSFENLNLLVTGGTGSFGKMFVRIMQAEYHPKKLIIFSRDELNQYEMYNSGLDQQNLRYFIGDVRDKERLYRAFKGVDIVVHAAALKQVPSCEYNPFEAVMTNIMGARNVIDAAIDYGVKQVIALSTDKAASPINLYGATKMVAEKLFVQANSYRGLEGTRFSCVRYGNVVGSRGSVIPLFLSQRSNGKITITDVRMTRFLISLKQGVNFVISCIERMQGGEVFVPKIPSMKIMDVAKAIAPECEIVYVGIRPGEKLHETLISLDEARQTYELTDRFVIMPAYHGWGSLDYKNYKPVDESFSYTSDTNTKWLTGEELKAIIND